ncbi:MAG: manganese efflux pump MntP family protein [Candidatus Hydrothermia bacterium]
MRNFLYFLLIILSINVDCFVSSVTEGLLLKDDSERKRFVIAFSFGLVQSLLFLCGYLLGSAFINLVSSFDHFLAFGLLFFVGIHMIYEDWKEGNDIKRGYSKRLGSLFMVALAVSIDSLAVGLVSSILVKRFYFFVLAVFVVTFIISILGVRLGMKFHKFSEKIRHAQSLGGVILILIGIKILLEHLGIF